MRRNKGGWTSVRVGACRVVAVTCTHLQCPLTEVLRSCHQLLPCVLLFLLGLLQVPGVQAPGQRPTWRGLGTWRAQVTASILEAAGCSQAVGARKAAVLTSGAGAKMKWGRHWWGLLAPLQRAGWPSRQRSPC